MHQSEVKNTIKECLSMLKDNILSNKSDEKSIAIEIDNLSEAISKMISGLENVAFKAGRANYEETGEFDFEDYDDFLQSMNE
jgi:hypothetical protein